MSCLARMIFVSRMLRLIHLRPMPHHCLIDKLMMLLPRLIIAHPLSHSLPFRHFRWTTFLSGAHWWDSSKITCFNSSPPVSRNRCRIVYFSTLTNVCQAPLLLGLRPFLMSGPVLDIPQSFSYTRVRDNYPPEGYWRVGGCYLLVDVGSDATQLNLLIISSTSARRSTTFDGPRSLMCIKSP